MPKTDRPEPVRWLVFVGTSVALTSLAYATAEEAIETVRQALGDRCSRTNMKARPATVEDILHHYQLMELSR